MTYKRITTKFNKYGEPYVVYIDVRANKTKIETKKHSNYYDGIYPNHYPIPYKRFKKW